MNTETIFALASGGGKAGVAVYRVSGGLAGNAYKVLTASPLPAARRAVRVRILDAADDGPIDDG